jgi:hypothetical protein
VVAEGPTDRILGDDDLLASVNLVYEHAEVLRP